MKFFSFGLIFLFLVSCISAVVAQDPNDEVKPWLQLSEQESQKLLVREQQLMSELYNSLTPEQLVKAEPSPNCYRDSRLPDPGGLGFRDLNTHQLTKLIMLCRIHQTIMGEYISPSKIDNRIWAKKDAATGNVRGEVKINSRYGHLFGLNDLDPKKADKIQKSLEKTAQVLWMSLDEDQKKQALRGLDPGDFKADSLPYDSLSMDQRELFMEIMDASVILSGEGRSHLTGETSKWMVVFDDKENMLWLELYCIGHGFKITP